MSRFAIAGVHIPAVVSAAPLDVVRALAHEKAPSWAVRLRSGVVVDAAHIELPKGRYRLTAALACRAERLLNVSIRTSVSAHSAQIVDDGESRYAEDRISAGVPFSGPCLPVTLKPWMVKVTHKRRYYLGVEGVFAGVGAAALSVIGHLSAERV